MPEHPEGSVLGALWYDETEGVWEIEVDGVLKPLLSERPLLGAWLKNFNPQGVEQSVLEAYVTDLSNRADALLRGEELGEPTEEAMGVRPQRALQRIPNLEGELLPGAGDAHRTPEAAQWYIDQTANPEDWVVGNRRDRETGDPAYYVDAAPPPDEEVPKGGPIFATEDLARSSVPPRDQLKYDYEYQPEISGYRPVRKKEPEVQAPGPPDRYPTWDKAVAAARLRTSTTGVRWRAESTDTGHITIERTPEQTREAKEKLPQSQQAHITQTYIEEGADAALALDAFYDKVNADPYVAPTLSISQKMDIAQFAANNTTTEEGFSELFNSLTGGIYEVRATTSKQRAAEATAFLQAGPSMKATGESFTGIPFTLDPTVAKHTPASFTGTPIEGEGLPPGPPGAPSPKLSFQKGAGLIDLSGFSPEEMKGYFGEGFGESPSAFSLLPTFSKKAFATQADALAEAEANEKLRQDRINRQKQQGGTASYSTG